MTDWRTRIEEARLRYHRLLLVVGPSGAGKTNLLQKISNLYDCPVLPVNLELSRRLLDQSERQRSLHLPRLLGELVEEAAGDPVLLDNLELLFDVRLQVDPLRLLQGLSRNRTIVAAWNGSIEGGCLTYAVPDHPEYRRYPSCEVPVIRPEGRP